MDPRDIALQRVAPTVMVPRYSPLESLADPGHRFLACRDGLWLELVRPWLRLVLPLSRQHDVAMPYGEVTPEFQLACGPLPRNLVREFAKVARVRAPTECAAWVVWRPEQGFRLIHLEETSAGVGHVQVIRPALEAGEHLVVDIHSHGLAPAFFSGTDDRDDAGEVKLSLVFGNLDQPLPTVAIRLCALGIFLNMAPGNLDEVEEGEFNE